MDFHTEREFLVTIDIEALYTNIPQQAAIQAVTRVLSRDPGDRPNEFIIDCLEIVLTQNFFEFEDKLYHQLKGVSMGASCAPNVANAFMGVFEEQHIFNEVAPFFENVRLWSRYIDDIFFIWSGEQADLTQFLQWLNACNSNLRITEHFSRN